MIGSNKKSSNPLKRCRKKPLIFAGIIITNGLIWLWVV